MHLNVKPSWYLLNNKHKKYHTHTHIMITIVMIVKCIAIKFKNLSPYDKLYLYMYIFTPLESHTHTHMYTSTNLKDYSTSTYPSHHEPCACVHSHLLHRFITIHNYCSYVTIIIIVITFSKIITTTLHDSQNTASSNTLSP